MCLSTPYKTPYLVKAPLTARPAVWPGLAIVLLVVIVIALYRLLEWLSGSGISYLELTFGAVAHGVLAVLSSKMGGIAEMNGTAGWLYRASKAAVNAALKATSLEAHGSTCIALHPGWVRTEMGGSSAAIDPAHSISGMRAVIASAAADPKKFNGTFVQYDGTPLAW